MNRTDLLLDLFDGNHSAIGTEEGGCLRLDDEATAIGGFRHWLVTHFDGTGPPVGVYPMVDFDGEWRVKWGCVDFDEGEHDSFIHARNLVQVLGHFSVAGHIEKSRSKGYHVWVFALDWVPAPIMRDALLGACQVVDAPTREINPKQYHLGEGQLGNYVRLPFPGANPGAIDGHRMVWTPVNGDWSRGGFPADRDSWAHHAWHCRADPLDLQQLGELYEPPVLNVSKAFGTGRVARNRPAERRLSGLAWTMYTEGPLAGQTDRSEWLWALARELVKSDITASEAQDFLYQAHDQWAPKWSGRPDGGRPQLDRMLAKAAGG